jgi:hypothetical protein
VPLYLMIFSPMAAWYSRSSAIRLTTRYFTPKPPWVSNEKPRPEDNRGEVGWSNSAMQAE